MGESLQEQLVKAGLADEKKAREARQQKPRRKKGEGSGKGRGRPGRSEESRVAAEAADAQRREQAERDRRLESQRQEQRAARERAEQVAQIVRSQRLSREGAEIPYNFTDGRRIKALQVTESQQQQLARGEVAMVRAGRGFELVPASAARRIQELDPEQIAVWNTEPEEDASGE